MKKLKAIIKRIFQPKLESGNLGCLKARRNTQNGKVEIYAPRSNPEHSLWVETHKDHWSNFEKNQ
jgi:hypothetical protein